MDRIGGVDDDLAGEGVGMFADQRLGRVPGRGKDHRVGADQGLATVLTFRSVWSAGLREP